MLIRVHKRPLPTRQWATLLGFRGRSLFKLVVFRTHRPPRVSPPWLLSRRTSTHATALFAYRTVHSTNRFLGGVASICTSLRPRICTSICTKLWSLPLADLRAALFIQASASTSLPIHSTIPESHALVIHVTTLSSFTHHPRARIFYSPGCSGTATTTSSRARY